jgi:hypothetical protein
MKTDKPVSEEEFLTFLKSNVATWSDAERIKLEAAITGLRAALERLPISFPRKVLFIKTTGAEEGRAFYTRDTAIMMPERQTDEADTGLLKKRSRTNRFISCREEIRHCGKNSTKRLASPTAAR